MRGHAKLVALTSALPTIAVLAHGCKEPTQVTVDVKTNVVCADMRGVELAVGSDPRRAEERASLVPTSTGPRFPSASTKDCTEGPSPREVGTLVVTPSGSTGAVVVVAAFGETNVADCVAPQLPARCIIARRRFSFVENRRVTMPIVLDPDCAGVPCNETSTCVGKKCVDSEVDCSGDECTEPGVSADGGVIEVDAFSPLVDGSPPIDDGSVPTDGPNVNDGGDGSVSDAGGDADGSTAPGVCPGVMSCIPSNGTAAACTDPAKCCYGSPTVCLGLNDGTACAGMVACCNGASVCAQGEVCCANTSGPTAGTVIGCHPPGECVSVKLCSAMDTDCHGTTCRTDWPAWSMEPNYFECS